MAPGERIVLDLPVPAGDTLELQHSYPRPDSSEVRVTLAKIAVGQDSVDRDFLSDFYQPAARALAVASIDSFRKDFSRPPEKRLLLAVRMDHGALPKRAHDSVGKGIEWEEHSVMGMANSQSHTGNTRWIIRALDSGKENHAIDWIFHRGDRVPIRNVNDSTSMHPMPHPIHFHGQRFLVVRINGHPNDELAWKDTCLVGRGETADILLDAGNPGRWMAHCHIPEHLESMMMFSYTVDPVPRTANHQ